MIIGDVFEFVYFDELARNLDLFTFIKSLFIFTGAMASKQENERRRKQLESQNAELQMKLQESEKNHGENQDKYSKLLTELESMATALSEAENKAITSTRNADGLEAQLSEAQAMFEDETRQKLSLQSRYLS